MILQFDNKIFDTNKMEFISEKCEWEYKDPNTYVVHKAYNVKLWRTKKDEWLLTYSTNYYPNCGQVLKRGRAREYLRKYDPEMCKKIFKDEEDEYA